MLLRWWLRLLKSKIVRRAWDFWEPNRNAHTTISNIHKFSTHLVDIEMGLLWNQNKAKMRREWARNSLNHHRSISLVHFVEHILCDYSNQTLTHAPHQAMHKRRASTDYRVCCCPYWKLYAVTKFPFNPPPSIVNSIAHASWANIYRISNIIYACKHIIVALEWNKRNDDRDHKLV